MKPYKKQIILGSIFKLLEAIFELLIPTIMVLIIDKGIKSRDTVYIFKIGGLMAFMAILGVSASFTCQYFASIASQGFGTRLRNGLFEKIQSFSFYEIDEFGTASLINRITNDINQLQLALAMFIRLAIRVPFLCTGGVIMAMFLDLKLSSIMILSLPLFLFVLYLIMSKSTPLYGLVQKKLDKLALVLRENLSGIRVIRAFGMEAYEKKRFDNSNEDLLNTAISVGKIVNIMNPVTNLIMNASLIAILWFGAIRVNNGALTQGKIIAFINYTTLVLSALIIVANLVIIFTKAGASLKRVNEILMTESTIKDISSYKEIEDESAPIIEFDKVSFMYKDAGDYSLQDISFKIKKGQTIGIIGSTGAGKTSIINLIPRFYDAVKGKVLVKGVDVKQYRKDKLRNMIGVVQQKPVLFTGTIKDNISWGLENATEEEIKKAAKIAQAHKFIEGMKEGYDTVIFHGGVNFSGGQKQRLTIARALVKNPEILILDDCSSALDFATDLELRKALKNNTKDMTVIMVTQRITTIENADMIIVLNDGKIEGVGTNDELLKSCLVYKEIYNSQLQKEVTDEKEEVI